MACCLLLLGDTTQTKKMSSSVPTNDNYIQQPPPPQQSQPMDREQAAAIAEVSVMPENGPPTITTGDVGGAVGGSRRATTELDDVVMQGDVQQLDEAGVQVRSLFLEFLYQL